MSRASMSRASVTADAPPSPDIPGAAAASPARKARATRWARGLAGVVIGPGPSRGTWSRCCSSRDQTATRELPEFVHLRAEVSRLVRSRTAPSVASAPSAS